MNKELADWREKIDKLDDTILKLLADRKKTVLEVGEIKKKNGFKIVDKEREEEIFSDLRKKASELGLDENYVVSLFEKIIKNSREEENNGK